MADLDREQFERDLKRWFLADGLDAPEIDRLWQAWQNLAAQPGRLRALDQLFMPTVQAALGSDWWENRQRGSDRTVLPITAADRARMMLTADPTVPGRPRPVPYCPAEVSGSWRCLDAPAQRLWTLKADGRMTTVGDPDRDGGTWRVHREPLYWYLWIEPPDADVEAWRIRRREPGEMDLTPPEEVDVFLRWSKV